MAKTKNPESTGEKLRTEQTGIRITKLLQRKIKYIAFKDEISQNDIAEKALEEYIDRWEKKHGTIKD